jgi:hypothetical protein
MKPIKLDLQEMLPIVRKAFDEKTLQMFTAEPGQYGCLYAAPCAIGVCLPEDVRVALDDGSETDHNYAADSLFLFGYFTCPEGQGDDITRLQYHHDLCVGPPNEEDKANRISDFEAHLSYLEAKYRPGAEL